MLFSVGGHTSDATPFSLLHHLSHTGFTPIRIK